LARYINFLLLILMGTTWGLHFTLIKQITNAGVPGHLILLPTLAGVAIVFLILMFITKSPRSIDRTCWVFLLICSVLGYAFPIWLELVVANHIDATLITLIVTSTPVFCIMFGFLFRLAKITIYQLAAVILGITATIMLLIPNSALPISSSRLWLAIGIGIPISYAFYNLYVPAAWPKNLSLFTMAAYESILASILALPLFFSGITSGIHQFALHGNILISLVIVTAIEVWSFFELVRRAGAIYVSFASFAALISGIGWSALLLNEQITLWMSMSIAAILISLILCLMGDKSQKNNG
jgi:drug/metabolite transporter (DMT)-like permease